MPHVRLASKRCATCIFNPQSGFDLDELRKRWRNHGHQTCHQFYIQGQRKRTAKGESRDVWCRGFWDNEMPADQKELLTQCCLVEIVPQKSPPVRKCATKVSPSL